MRHGSLALIPLRARRPLRRRAHLRELRSAALHAAIWPSDFLAHLGVVVGDLPGERGESRAPAAQRRHRLPHRLPQPPLSARAPARGAGARRSAPAAAGVPDDRRRSLQARSTTSTAIWPGTTVLREVAQRIDAEMRVSDTGARFGGDEFAIVLPQADIARRRSGWRSACCKPCATTPIAIMASAHGDRDAVDRRRRRAPEPGSRDYKAAGGAADRRGRRRALSRQERRAQPRGDLAATSSAEGAARGRPLAALAQQHDEQRRADQRHDRAHRQLTRELRSCAPRDRRRRAACRPRAPRPAPPCGGRWYEAASRTACGVISPTKPTVPALTTATAVSMAQR